MPRRQGMKVRDLLRKSKRRESLEFKILEQDQDTLEHKRMRETPQARRKEQDRNMLEHKRMRETPQARRKEQDRNMLEHKRMRETPEARPKEQDQNTLEHKRMKETPEARQKEQERDTKNHQTSRSDPDFRMVEQRSNTEAHQSLRTDPKYRKVEQSRDTEAHKVRAIRHSQNWIELFDEFEQSIKKGPTLICSCCGGLWWFSRSITTISDERKSKIPIDILDYVLQTGVAFQLCGTCHKDIFDKRKPKLPRLCLGNGFGFPHLPQCLLELTPLEERLVSPRILFMQIRRLGFSGQSRLKGNVVNILNDLDICAKALPRRFEDTSTVQVMLMRRMVYKSPYMYETIRPRRVLAAAAYLSTTPLYMNEGIVLSSDWTHANEFVVEALDKLEVEFSSTKMHRSFFPAQRIV